MGDPKPEAVVLLIQGFGVNTNHWLLIQPVLAEKAPTYATEHRITSATRTP